MLIPPGHSLNGTYVDLIVNTNGEIRVIAVSGDRPRLRLTGRDHPYTEHRERIVWRDGAVERVQLVAARRLG
jgi:hypothetical protein